MFKRKNNNKKITKKNVNKGNNKPMKETLNFKKLTSITSPLGKFFKALRETKESQIDIKSLDDKVSAKLQESGYNKLATKLDKKTAKERKKSIKKQKAWIPAARWAIASFSIVAMATAGVIYYTDFYNQPENLSDLRNEVGTPVITLEPTQETESGYVATSSAFKIDMSSTVKGNIADAIKVTPDLAYEVAVTQVEGSQQLVLEPQEELEKDVTYSLTFVEGTGFEDGSVLRKDLTWVFMAEPEFAITGTTPRDEAIYIPVDTVLEFEFNHKNISAQELANYVTIQPAISGKYEQYGLKVVLIPEAPLPEATTYKVTVSGEFTNSKGDELGNDKVFSFTTDNNESSSSSKYYLHIWNNGAVHHVTDSFEVGYSAYSRNGTNDGIAKFYKVSSEDAVADLVSTTGAVQLPASAQFEGKMTVKPHEKFTYTPKGKGFYIVEITDERAYKPAYAYLLKSDINAIFANTGDVTQGWVYDMPASQPVKDAQVQVYMDEKVISTVKTGTDGYYNSSNDGEIIIAKHGDQYAVVGERSSGMWGWWGSIGGQYTNITFDKPIYRAGDTVRFEGIVRTSNGSQVLVPDDMPEVKVTVGVESYGQTDGRLQVPLYENTLPVDIEYGVFDDSFVIPQNADYSTITFRVEDGDGNFLHRESIRVTDYTKLRESYETSFDKTVYNVGDNPVITIVGKDYSGLPLVGQNLRLKVRANNNMSPNLFHDGVPTRGSSWGDVVLEKDISLDKNGVATVNLTYDDYISSGNGQFIGLNAEVVSVDEDVYIYGVYDQSILPSSELDIQVHAPDDNSIVEGEGITLDIKGKEVWGNSSVGNSDYSISISRDWVERNPLGEKYNPATKSHYTEYSYDRQSEVIYENDSSSTNDKGLATVSLKDLDYGTYSALISYHVDGIQVVKEYEYVFYVTRKEDALIHFNSANNILDVNIVQDTVKVGDVVDINVYGKKDMSGILSVNGAGIFQKEKLVIGKDDPFSMKLTVTEDMFPYVNVCAFVVVPPVSNGGLGYQWKYECDSFTVETDLGMLYVDVESDKQVYKPGEKVKLDITVTDRNGNPTAGHIGLRVVDQALLNSTYFNEYEEEDLRNSLYYNVRSPIAWKLGNPNEVNEGGMGAGGLFEGDSRGDFEDVAYWNPSIIIDSSGKTTVEFEVKDSLTTWNVQAIGVNMDDSIGAGYTEFKTQLDRYLDVRLPKFVRKGDRVSGYTYVGNFSDKTLNGEVVFKCVGCIDTDYSKSVKVSPSATQKVTLELYPAEGQDELTVTASLMSGTDLIDAITMNVPVLSDGVIDKSVIPGLWNSADPQYQLDLDLGNDFSRTNTRVNVNVSKKFALGNQINPVDVTGSSTADLASSILINKFIYDNYNTFKPAVEKDVLAGWIDVAYTELQTHQAQNGGFGMFSYDAVSLDASVLAAQAFGELHDSEVSISPVSDTYLVQYLTSILSSSERSSEDKVHALLGISHLDSSTAHVYLSYVVDMFNEDEQLKNSPLAISYLMQTFNELGSTGDTAYWSNILAGLAQDSDNHTYWDDIDTNTKVKQSSDYVTAMAYMALSPIEQWDVKYQVKNWMFAGILGDDLQNWQYTMSMYAIAVGDKEDIDDSSYKNDIKIYVNDEEVADAQIADDHSVQGLSVSVDSKYLRPGSNTVRVEKSGEGDLYVSVDVESLVNKDTIGSGEVYNVTRSITDLDTDNILSEDVPLYKAVRVQVKVELSEASVSKDVVVRDYVPTGFEPIHFENAGVSQSLRESFWTWSDISVNRWGNIATDYVTFTQSEMKEGETYTYEYVMIPTYPGVVSGGGTHVFTYDSPDIATWVNGGTLNLK